MIATAAVLLALAGPAQAAPRPAGAPVEVLAQNRVDEAEARAAHQPGYGPPPSESSNNEIDYVHHVQDSRDWETPFGRFDFPAAHTWQVGPVDFTPTKDVMFLGFAAVLTVLFLVGGASLAARARRGVTAGKRHNLVEAMVLFVRNEVVMPNVGHGGEKFAPFICTLFFFIMFANLLGLLPYGSSATASISVTLALALLTFVVVEVGGFMSLGLKGYLHTIWFRPPGMGTISGIVMAICLLPIEIVSKFTRPFALTIRLMANMTGGHIVLLAVISLIFVFGSYAVAVGPVLMAVAITFLEIFVAFLQAFIFAILSAVFIGLVRNAGH